MMKKTAFNTASLKEMPWFNHGIKLKDVEETFIVTGICDCTSEHFVKYPDNPVGQAKQILIYMEELFTKAGYSKQDIVYIDWAVTKDVTREQVFEILKVWEEYIADMEIKPAAGIFKFVHSLITPDMLVEFELTLAK